MMATRGKPRFQPAAVGVAAGVAPVSSISPAVEPAEEPAEATEPAPAIDANPDPIPEAEEPDQGAGEDIAGLDEVKDRAARPRLVAKAVVVPLAKGLTAAALELAANERRQSSRYQGVMGLIEQMKSAGASPADVRAALSRAGYEWNKEDNTLQLVDHGEQEESWD